MTIRIERLNSNNPLEFIKPFDLGKAPLLRVGYYENTVMIDVHHIVADGSSSAILFRDLNELYMDRELPEAVQYGEFSVTDTYTEEDEKYWLNTFAEEVEALELPTDYPRPEKQSFKGTNIYTRIDNTLNEKILKKCRQLNVTPYVYYMTCYNILLSKYSGKEDICIGTPTSRRSGKYLNTIGMFVNMLSLRSCVAGEMSFADFVNQVRSSSVEALSHQNYPQQELIRKTGNKKTLYDVMFAYQWEEMTEFAFGDKKVEVQPTPATSVKSEIAFYVLPRENEVVLLTEYCTDLYKEETINRLIEAYISLLTASLDSEALIKDISVLNESEGNKILNDFNDTKYEYDIPENSTLYSLFEKASEENKEKVCLVADNKEITFGEFKSYAERIDSRIRNITNEEKSVIAVICERSFEMYGAVYGIIRGGNAYLPIAPDYPQERIDYILENSNAKAVVTQDKFCHLVRNIPCINATDILESKETVDSTPILANEDDTAYVIYTSGSTGNPKGAKISHKSAVNRTLWMHDFYPLEENDVILQKTPYTFDVSVWELFWWGIKGRTLCASKPDEHFLPAKILNETEKNRVTHLHFVPSVFDIFLTYLENNPDEQYKFNSVKYVFLSGEALSANSIRRFYNIYDYNKVSLHNLYGPTECAVDVSYYPCVPTDVDPVPIGKPIYNTQLYIVDKNLNPTPIGVIGELCIGGVNVGQGYLNNETLTNEKFIDNPFHEGKIYKTGDLAYWRNDGQICYAGRMDNQIKLNGQRIELGEIENAITEIDGVVNCAVVVRKDKENIQRICAFYTGKDIEERELRSILSEILPRYMVPHVFTYLPEMPMTVSGKLDRKLLPDVDFCNISIDTEYSVPVTKEELQLARALEKVLDVKAVNMLDNFFNLGGDSITAIYVVSELEDMGYELHVADIMQSETIAEIAVKMISTEKKEVYEQGEANGFIPYTPIMKAFLNESKEIPTDFVHTCTIATACNGTELRKVLDALVSHHDMLRGTFAGNGIEVHPSDERQAYSFRSVGTKAELEASESADSLVNVVFFESEGLVKISVHHFLIDLVSWEILLQDFWTAAEQLKNNEEIRLPSKTASFKLWNDELQEYSAVIPEENRAYWSNIDKILENAVSLCSAEEVNDAEKFAYTFDKEASDKLLIQVNNKYGTRTNEVLLTALGLAAAGLGDGYAGIMTESHGRTVLNRAIAVERTVGWFTACYPVIVNKNDNVAAELISVKEAVRRVPKIGVEYLLINERLYKNSGIIFNFYKTSLAESNIIFEGKSIFPGKINVNCFAIDELVTITIDVPECKHRKNIAKELGDAFVKTLERIIDECLSTDEIVKTRSDFSDETLTEDELDELMDLFN